MGRVCRFPSAILAHSYEIRATQGSTFAFFFFFFSDKKNASREGPGRARWPPWRRRPMTASFYHQAIGNCRTTLLHISPYSPESVFDLDSYARKTTNDDDADLKWVLEFERELMDMEMGSCKVAPAIADSTNETKKGTAFSTGRGEVLTPLAPLPTIYLHIIKPEVGLSTPEVFRALALGACSQRDPLALLGLHTTGAAGDDKLISNLEAPAFQCIPALADLKRKLASPAPDGYGFPKAFHVWERNLALRARGPRRPGLRCQARRRQDPPVARRLGLLPRGLVPLAPRPPILGKVGGLAG
jgi:hypothetical protein